MATRKTRRTAAKPVQATVLGRREWTVRFGTPFVRDATGVLPPHREAYERARLAVKEWRGELSQRDDVVGYDVGLKQVGGQYTDTTAVRIYVRRKVKTHRRLGSRLLPQHFHGAPVDVIAAEFHPAVNPLQSPDQIAPADQQQTNAGRLTALVADERSSERLLLTCAHVVQGTRSTAQMEQGVRMVDVAGRPIGDLIAPGEGHHWLRGEYYDCALLEPVVDGSIECLPGVRGDRFQLRSVTDLFATDINRTVYLPPPSVAGGGKVTEGLVHAVGGTYQESTGITMRDHILVLPRSGEFALGGDSGAPVFVDNFTAAGMVRAVAKDPQTKVTIGVAVTPLFRTLVRLGVRIVREPR